MSSEEDLLRAIGEAEIGGDGRGVRGAGELSHCGVRDGGAAEREGCQAQERTSIERSLEDMSCRTGPLRVARSLRDLYTFFGACRCLWSSRWSG